MVTPEPPILYLNKVVQVLSSSVMKSESQITSLSNTRDKIGFISCIYYWKGKSNGEFIDEELMKDILSS